jgi:hypothetical protein
VEAYNDRVGAETFDPLHKFGSSAKFVPRLMQS